MRPYVRVRLRVDRVHFAVYSDQIVTPIPRHSIYSVDHTLTEGDERRAQARHLLMASQSRRATGSHSTQEVDRLLSQPILETELLSYSLSLPAYSLSPPIT